MEAIGQLAGGIAHDFNNLLTVILGQTELLTMDNVPDDVRQEAIRDIRAASQRAAKVTRQLLVFSRREPMRTEVADLNRLVSGEVDLLRRLIGEDILFTASLAAEPLPVLGDTGMIQQLLLNLVLNARDAMQGGGRLTIATSACVLDGANPRFLPHAVPGCYVRLSITDTGNGIPPEVLPRIFEPFFTTKPRGKGTGLGLAISHGIVQQHRGWIEVETRTARGTTFHAWFPKQPGATVSEMPAAPARRPRSAAATVLLVEDETEVRTIAARVLNHHGYHVIEASCGAEGLTQWERHRGSIDVLLTDIIMPGPPNGHELALRLAKEEPNLHVITMSGYDPHAAGVQATPESARIVHLRKPFTADELLAVFTASGGAVLGGGLGAPARPEAALQTTG
jgi:CheY-like chemotaxis protein